MIKNIILTISLILIMVSVVQADENKYGGIASSINKPPPGTMINEGLSDYYGTIVVTGNNITYWYIGGYGWFNQTEMLNLPAVSLMHDISPYDCESYGCGSSSDSTIPVPISGFVILGFIVAVIVILRKNAPH